MNLCHNVMIFQNLVIMNLFTFFSSVDSEVLNRVQQVTCLNQQRRGFQQRSFYLIDSYNEEEEICAMYFASLFFACIYFP